MAVVRWSQGDLYKLVHSEEKRFVQIGQLDVKDESLLVNLRFGESLLFLQCKESSHPHTSGLRVRLTPV